jgi:muramoyltetrapeptide carboxypeptidase
MPSPAKPPSLRPGDPVRIVAPSGPFDRASFDKGLAVLARRYQVSFEDPGLFSKEHYLAGSDARRLAELQSALAFPSAKAVFAARGGYGAMRLLPSLDVASLRPRLLIGFSDITALHLAFQAAGRPSIHGPVVTQLGRAPEAAVTALFTLLETGFPAGPLSGEDAVVSGQAEGVLVGGNLSVLTRLLGTPYFPKLDGALLLLEDVGERPYRIDRMWTHLRLAGVLEHVAGVVLGRFSGCDEPDGSYSAAEVLTNLARELGRPCASGFPIGHEDFNVAVPLGVQARLDADAGSLSFHESVTEPVSSGGIA